MSMSVPLSLIKPSTHRLNSLGIPIKSLRTILSSRFRGGRPVKEILRNWNSFDLVVYGSSLWILLVDTNNFSIWFIEPRLKNCLKSALVAEITRAKVAKKAIFFCLFSLPFLGNGCFSSMSRPVENRWELPDIISRYNQVHTMFL